MPLFTVVVLQHPTKKEKEEEGKLETLIVQPTTLIAKDQQSAAFKVVMDNGEAINKADLSRIEVLARPF
jgi:hypothetical protein